MIFLNSTVITPPCVCHAASTCSSGGPCGRRRWASSENKPWVNAAHIAFTQTPTLGELVTFLCLILCPFMAILWSGQSDEKHSTKTLISPASPTSHLQLVMITFAKSDPLQEVFDSNSHYRTKWSWGKVPCLSQSLQLEFIRYLTIWPIIFRRTQVGFDLCQLINVFNYRKIFHGGQGADYWFPYSNNNFLRDQPKKQP